MRNSFSTQKQDWNNFWDLKQSKRFKNLSWSKRRIIKILRPYLKDKNKVLDAGCGTGFFSKCFCDFGMRTVSLDYSDAALTITKDMTRGKAQLIKADLISSDIANVIGERFDLIFSDGLFEHFLQEDQDKIIQNLSSLLLPKGVIVTFVPNQWSPWQIIRPLLMPGIKEKPFRLERLVDMNKRNALQVISSGGINVLPWAFSPEQSLGKFFGMLLYSVAQKR